MADAIQVARYVADHWRRVILDKFPSDSKWAAHPLCMVIAALDGETEPVELGLDPEVWDDYRAALIDGSACGPAGSKAPPDPHTTNFDDGRP